jgi:hypothetical protein
VRHLREMKRKKGFLQVGDFLGDDEKKEQRAESVMSTTSIDIFGRYYLFGVLGHGIVPYG